MSGARHLATLGVLAGAAYLAPAATALRPVRRLGFDALAGTGAASRVALTFDDGPDASSTPRFVAALEELDVHATFFLLGRMVSRSPWLVGELTAAGHEVAVHGWDHRPLLLRGAAATYEDLARAQHAVACAGGTSPTFYRPPYGVLTWAAWRAARRLSLTPVLWTAWGSDWRSRATPESVRSTVRRQLSPGGTILLHDSDCTSAPGSWRTTLAALPGIVEDVRSAGLVPGPLRDHRIGRP